MLSRSPSSRALRACAALCLFPLLAGCGSSSGGTSGGSTVAAATSNTAPVSSSSGGGATSTVVAQGQLEVLTYNVAGLPQGISGSNPAVNTTQISPKLNAYELVLVQEDFFYDADLRRQARHPNQSTPQPVSSRPVNDGLNRFSLTPWTLHDRVTWSASFGLVSNGSDTLATKGYSFARHELAPGVELDVYNLHADAGGDAGDENARAQQFAQLAQDLRGRSAGRAVLVAGDTNLKAARARDAQVLLDFLGVAGLRDCAREVGNKPELIDRIMIRDGGGLRLRPTQWRTADEFVDAQGGPLSDHAAVHVTLAWEFSR